MILLVDAARFSFVSSSLILGIQGDKIYMFGFSRGAFTAKFLARMINTVGLLCKGNEEMVPFAYRLYQRYLAGETTDFHKAHSKRKKATATADKHNEQEPLLNPHDEAHEVRHGHEYEEARDEITAFSNTFCRKEKILHCGKVEETNIKVYFLGIWDCVNSVAVFENTSPIPVPVKGTANFVRHAVAVDERRVKFKPALLAQDVRSSKKHDHEDIKEVWFPGGHGDVGGGWPADAGHPLDESGNREMSLWERIKNFWTTRKAKGASKDVTHDHFQLSDVPLSWMIHELELVGEKDPSAGVKWSNNVNGFKRRFQNHKKQALSGVLHDTLSFGYGTGFFTVLLWKVMGKLRLGSSRHEPNHTDEIGEQSGCLSSRAGSSRIMNGSTCGFH
jgi:uncharacterized protein (DUF2235 family)